MHPYPSVGQSELDIAVAALFAAAVGHPFGGWLSTSRVYLNNKKELVITNNKAQKFDVESPKERYFVLSKPSCEGPVQQW